MTQQYNQFTSSSSGNPPASDSVPNVPEDFDFTTFLLENRPRIPQNHTARQPTDDWPQRVQDVKWSGNPMPQFGMSDSSYSGPGWSPIRGDRTEFGGIRDHSRTSMYGSSFWEPSTESNSVFHGASTTTTANDTSTLGFVGSNPGLETNLSRIWGSDGAVGGNRMRCNTGGSSGGDYGAAVTEGRDMYEYAWNEWERPTPVTRTQTTDVKKQNTTGGLSKYRDSDNLEELRAAFYNSGSRKDRGESSVSVQSSSSWQSNKGNASAKDGCSNSSKTYSDIMKESRQSSKTSHETGNKKSQSKTKANSCGLTTSSAKVPSHYQQSVTPPPGFESSTLHVPVGPDSGYGLDDFMGTSAKVQRWLQQSQSETAGEVDDHGSIPKRKRAKKKKKPKRPDPLAGSVASFIRDWNSATSESTDPSSLDDLTKISSAYSTTTHENLGEGHVTTQPVDSCNKPNEMKSQVQDISVKKEEKAFFDPKRIFQETTVTKPEKRKVESKARSSAASTTQNFFDPKRIFQPRTEYSKDSKNSRQKGSIKVNSSSEKAKNSPDYNLYQSSMPTEHDYASEDSVPLTDSNHVSHASRYSIPVEEVGTDTTTTTTTTTSSPSSSPIHTCSGKLWREHLSGLGDNNNKETIKNKGNDPLSGPSSTTGVQSMKHGHKSSTGARLDSSPSKKQNAKSSERCAAQKDYSQSKKRDEDMRTRSQSRREAEQSPFCEQHHFVPDLDGDGIRISNQRFFSARREYSSKPSKHKAYSNDDADTKDYTSATGGERFSRKNCKSPPQPSTTSSKQPGRSHQTHESQQPGWKKNKTSRRYESRAGKHGKEGKDGQRHHHRGYSESPSAGDCNGSTRTHHGQKERSGRKRQDSEGTKGSSDTAAHYYDGKICLFGLLC